MLTLVTDRKKLKRARDMLAQALAQSPRRSVQSLSTPGGVIRDATVFHHDRVDLWGHVATGLWNKNRYFCGFGTQASESWQVALEINIPVKRLLSCSGQIAEDATGRLYYAHRGGLGGGKFSVPAIRFADLIRGFEREAVDAGGKDIPLFILGRLTENALPEGLVAYVHEAYRIREIRRSASTYAAALRRVGVTPGDDDGGDDSGYNRENDQDGVYTVKRQVAFRRLHGKVQNALVDALENYGFTLGTKRLKGGIAPDLYVKDSNGGMSVLFEIKIPPDAQSTFTAIGQLSVYSAGQSKQPRKVIVSRGLPRSPLFTEAFRSYRIEHLAFVIDDRDRVTFAGLDKLMAAS